jgi:hypothetical protein
LVSVTAAEDPANPELCPPKVTATPAAVRVVCGAAGANAGAPMLERPDARTPRCSNAGNGLPYRWIDGADAPPSLRTAAMSSRQKASTCSPTATSKFGMRAVR